MQQAGAHDKIRLSLYHGQDRMNLLQEDFADENKLNWQNTAAALHWQHHSSRFILQQNATFSRYRNTLDMGISSVSLNLSSGITQAGYAARLEWTRGNLQWNGGVEYNYYHFRPMQFEVSGSFIENETPKFREDAHEANAYLQADISSTPPGRYSED